MNPIHEIAFLVLTGSLGCWTWPSTTPCSNTDTLKVQAYEKPNLQSKPLKLIDRDSFKSYLNAEVGYEENGFAVFEIIENEWHQIMSESGQKLWLHLPSLEKQFQSRLTPEQKPYNSPIWKLEKIENLVSRGMAKTSADYSKYLRTEDLKTPYELSITLLAQVHERQLKSRLEETKTELPIGFVEIKLPCTYKEIAPGSRTGSCEASPRITAYELPEGSAPSMPISMTWANWAGKSFFEPNQKSTLEHLYVLTKKDNWLKIEVAFGDPKKRTRWIKTKDLAQFQFRTLPPAERVTALIHVLESTNRHDAAIKIKELAPEPGFQATGKTKWSADGVLWGEIAIQDMPSCSPDEARTLGKAWLPYKLDKKSAPILSWYSRGC